MTRIRAKCPRCGDVEFGVESIVVVGEAGSESHYRFVCPACTESVSRMALPEVIDLLVTAGVAVELLGGTVLTAQDRSLNPALTDEDIKEFRRLLARPDWFDRLRSSESPEP